MAAQLNILLFVTGAVIILSTLRTISSDELQEEGHTVTVDDIVFLIRSQKSSVHAKRAERTKENIESQCNRLNQTGCDVVLIHAKYEKLGSWILLPIFKSLVDDFPTKKWLFFCEEETQVNVAGLLEVLKNYDSSKPLLLGKALVDQVPSYIHLYKFHNLKYPDSEAGWLISRKLLEINAERWERESPNAYYSIDITHELAVFIWNDGNGTTVLNVPELCSNGLLLPREYKKGACVTQHHKDIIQCGEPVPQNEVLFAVKTCQKYHLTRAKVVVNTWGQYAENVIYYSHVKDDSIPTVEIKIPNVSKGQCSKAVEILKRFLEEKEQLKYNWLIYVDDDTILSVSRLMRLLSCYDPAEEIYLGERYGYGHSRMFGYDYITGGAGIVFSRAVVSSFIKKGLKCRSDYEIDDVVIGEHAKSFNIPATHSPLFHQAKPQEYALGYLEHQTPITFHKYTDNDPYEVYKFWFQADDETAARGMQSKVEKSRNNEL